MKTEPETRYASHEGVAIAYQVSGEGELDLIIPGGPASHLDVVLEVPGARHAYELIDRFARTIRFDRRGTGLSDPIGGPPTLEQQAGDVLAVMDAVGSEQAALFGEGEGTRMCALFAAMYPERVSALVLYEAYARGEDVITEEVRGTLLDIMEGSWGKGDGARIWAPSCADDPEFVRAWGRFERAAVTPSMARALVEMSVQSDITDILPTIRVPTLVLHRRDDQLVPARLGREFAELIPGAQYVELEGRDPLSFVGDIDGLIAEMEEFLTGRRSVVERDRALMTVMFTDVVDSTSQAAQLGDRSWRERLAAHDRVVRREIALERGREVKTMGDGFLATFDGPVRAIRAARAIRDATRGLGLDVRVGLHTGECELVGDDIGGLAVHIAARVLALAGPGEVLVSSTVKDLVVGSGLEFEDRGMHSLRGVPGDWRVHVA